MGSEVYGEENSEKAAVLLQRIVIVERCLNEPRLLHLDNGAPVKSVTLLSRVYDLGITRSRGRPQVSNVNPYSESMFPTEVLPKWPQTGFSS